MQKLSRSKKTALKRVVIGLGLITAFGSGYQLNEAKWKQLTKEPEKKVRELPPTSFRMDEYTPEGIKIADLEAIEALPFHNPDSAKFAALRLNKLTAEAVQNIADLKDENGQSVADTLSFKELEQRKNKLVNKLDTVYSEDFVKTGQEYHKLVCLEIYKCSRNGENQDLWEKSDEELSREVNSMLRLMKVKMSVLKKMRQRSAYPKKEFERDLRRMQMAQALRQESRIRSENNKAVAYLSATAEREHRAAFEAHKDSLRRALVDNVQTKRLAEFDSLFNPLNYLPQIVRKGTTR